MRYLLLFSLIVPLLAHQTVAQGTFENLDFESSTVPTSTPAGTFVSASEAVPGWTVYLGGTQQSSVLYNDLALGSAEVALEGPGYAYGSIIQGNYMVVLQSGDVTQGAVSASIAQTATIPASTQALLFIASPPNSTGWTVSMGGQNLSVVPLGPDGSSYEYYGANISSFAGQTETLQFTSLIQPGFPENMFLDAIQFSPNVIPEPQTWTLLLCGAGVLIFLRPKRKGAIH